MPRQVVHRDLPRLQAQRLLQVGRQRPVAAVDPLDHGEFLVAAALGGVVDAEEGRRGARHVVGRSWGWRGC